MNKKEIEQKRDVSGVIEEIFGKDLHYKQKDSLGYAAMGILESESLILHRIGKG